MNSGGSDSFDYLLQLTKALSAECRANRQETDRIELLLKRLAKQSGISYDNLSKNIIPDSWKDNASQKASPPLRHRNLSAKILNSYTRLKNKSTSIQRLLR